MQRNALDAIEREITGEQASSLGRCGRKLACAILVCERLNREIRAIEERLARPATANGFNAYRQPRQPCLARRRDLVERFNRAQAEAARQRYYLIVQREAIGFRNHREVERRYRAPAPRRGRLFGSGPNGTTTLES